MTFVLDPQGQQVQLSPSGMLPREANTAFGPTPGVYAADYPGQQIPQSLWDQQNAGSTQPASQNLTAQPVTGTTSVSQQPRFATSQANYQNPLLTTPSAGANQTGQAGYVNPSQVTQSTKEFGQDSAQFNVPPFAQPFPFEQQKGENQQLVAGFEQAIAGQETLPAMRSRYENRFFIPELREQFQTGREALADVIANIRSMPETVAGTTRESLVTEAQRQNLITSKLQPLREVAAQMGENVTRIGQMLTENEKNLNTAMMYEIAQQKKELMPWQWKYSLSNLMQAREMTGWTKSNQLELDRLLANQSAGLKWTNAETQRAHDLAIKEMEFQNALDQIRLTGEQNRETARYKFVDLEGGISSGWNPDWL